MGEGGGGPVSKNFVFGPQFGLIIRGASPAVPLTWIGHCLCEWNTETREFSTSQKFVRCLVNIA